MSRLVEFCFWLQNQRIVKMVSRTIAYKEYSLPPTLKLTLTLTQTLTLTGGNFPREQLPGYR